MSITKPFVALTLAVLSTPALAADGPFVPVDADTTDIVAGATRADLISGTPITVGLVDSDDGVPYRLRCSAYEVTGLFAEASCRLVRGTSRSRSFQMGLVVGTHVQGIHSDWWADVDRWTSLFGEGRICNCTGTSDCGVGEVCGYNGACTVEGSSPDKDGTCIPDPQAGLTVITPW